MDMAKDFTMGIWVEVVATVGVGTVGVEFTGTVGIGVAGMGWAITLTLYLLLAGTLVLLFFSFMLGPGAFLVMGLLFWRWALVLDCNWIWVGGVWDKACLPILGRSSSFRWWRVGTEPCAPGIAVYNLCGSIPPKCVDPSHHFYLNFYVHSF